MAKPIQDIRFAGRESKSGPSEYETGVLPIQLQLPVCSCDYCS